MTRRAEAVLVAAAVAAQGPLLAYLARLGAGGFLGLTAAAFLLASVLYCQLSAFAVSDPRRAGWATTAAGSLAMLLGWWADAGFAPLVGSGACLCGCADSPAGLGLLTRLQWMQAGMVAACALVALAHERTGHPGPMRLAARILASSGGMLLGMAGAGWLAAGLRPAGASAGLIASYLAMAAGMTLGHAAVGRLLDGRISRPGPAAGGWASPSRP